MWCQGGGLRRADGRLASEPGEAAQRGSQLGRLGYQRDLQGVFICVGSPEYIYTYVYKYISIYLVLLSMRFPGSGCSTSCNYLPVSPHALPWKRWYPFSRMLLCAYPSCPPCAPLKAVAALPAPILPRSPQITSAVPAHYISRLCMRYPGSACSHFRSHCRAFPSFQARTCKRFQPAHTALLYSCFICMSRPFSSTALSRFELPR